ncbi:MAG: putative toxin-antitoxin system toxin component, PIN family [Anaerolineales bacterium]|nr:putative toxin-antitoxin system toxin component, PIN family [Anaerolineales bacterium]
MLRVVFDTNILVSGIIASGYSALIIDAALREEIKLVSSAHMLEEFSEVITRRHIAKKYPKAAENADILLDFLRAFSILTAGVPTEAISIDRDDDYVLACVIGENVDAIVSGDPHLLSLKSYKGTPILSPKDFVIQYLSH